MYVTAGFGPSAHNEGFTIDYDLPNETAYAETCASVALIFWAQRMLNLDLDGKYADVMELGLFNGALSGLAADGTHYFYENTLESDGTPQALGLAQLPVLHDERVAGWSPRSAATSTRPARDMIAVHLYGGNTHDLDRRRHAGDAGAGERFPVVGRHHDPGRTRSRAERVHVKLRIPGWTENATRHGQRRGGGRRARPRRAISRSRGTGRRATRIALDLPMPVRRLYAASAGADGRGPRGAERAGRWSIASSSRTIRRLVSELRLPRSCGDRRDAPRRPVRRHRGAEGRGRGARAKTGGATRSTAPARRRSSRRR